MSLPFAHGIVAASGEVAGGGFPVAELDGWSIVLTTRSDTSTFAISAGNDRLLKVAEYTRAGAASPVTAIAYGGQAMTKIVGRATITGPDLDTGLWYLDEAGIAAASGSGFTITPTTGGVQFRLAAASYENVDQTTPIVDSDGAVNEAGGTPTAPTLDSIEDGYIVGGLFANRGTSDGPSTEDATWTNMTEEFDFAHTQSYISIADEETTGTTFAPVYSITHDTAAHFLGATLRPTATGGGPPPPGGGSPGGSKIPDPPADLGFANGVALRYVTANGTSNPIGGETATSKHTTIQSAIDAANPGDVVLVRSDTYRESFPLTKPNFAGTVSNPLWIVAEERGQAIISALWAAADLGTQNWTDDTGGVWFAAHGKTYVGSHGDDFLMHYITEADLRATTVSGVTKPAHGLAFVAAENRVYVRLRSDVDPNGQSIKIPDQISQTIFDFNNADNIILDGFVIEGSGTTSAVEFDANCANPVVRNCVFDQCRFGVRCQDNTWLYCPEYRFTGFGAWCAEVLALDGKDNNGPFTLAKTYFNAAAIGESGGTGNALLEGGLDVGTGSGAAVDNVLIELPFIHSCFDGSKIGRHNNSEIKDGVFLQCRDDGFEDEGLSALQPSNNNEIHDCRFIDCFVGGSHQASFVIGESWVYRCVFENRNADFQHDTHYFIKMLQTAVAAQIHYYQNTFVNISAPGAVNQWLWYAFNNGTGDRIRNFLNNIVIFPGSFTLGTGPQPVVKNGNALVAPGPNTTLQGAAGTYAGTAESDMGLNADYSLPAGSPAAGIGVALPGGFPDTGLNNDDAGAFPVGVASGANWPREASTAFDLNPPAVFVGGLPTVSPQFGGPFAPWAIPAAGLSSDPSSSAEVDEIYDAADRFNLNARNFCPAVFKEEDATLQATLDINDNGNSNLPDASSVPWNPAWNLPTDSDAQGIIIDTATGRCHTFSQASYNSGTNTLSCNIATLIQDGVETTLGATANIFEKENGTRVARACGIAYPLMLPTRDELLSGVIPHCIPLLIPQPSQFEFVAPAIKGAGGTGGDPGRSAMGKRIVWALTDNDIDTWLLTQDATNRPFLRTIANCLRDYGAIMADNGGNFGSLIGAMWLEHDNSADWDSIGFTSTAFQALHSLLQTRKAQARVVIVPTHIGGLSGNVACYADFAYPSNHPCFVAP